MTRTGTVCTVKWNEEARPFGAVGQEMQSIPDRSTIYQITSDSEVLLDVCARKGRTFNTSQEVAESVPSLSISPATSGASSEGDMAWRDTKVYGSMQKWSHIEPIIMTDKRPDKRHDKVV